MAIGIIISSFIVIFVANYKLYQLIVVFLVLPISPLMLNLATKDVLIVVKHNIVFIFVEKEQYIKFHIRNIYEIPSQHVDSRYIVEFTDQDIQLSKLIWLFPVINIGIRKFGISRLFCVNVSGDQAYMEGMM